MCAAGVQLYTSQLSAKLITAGVQDPFKGPGSSEVLDALSCMLSDIFNAFCYKMGF